MARRDPAMGGRGADRGVPGRAAVLAELEHLGEAPGPGEDVPEVSGGVLAGAGADTNQREGDRNLAGFASAAPPVESRVC